MKQSIVFSLSRKGWQSTDITVTIWNWAGMALESKPFVKGTSLQGKYHAFEIVKGIIFWLCHLLHVQVDDAIRVPRNLGLGVPQRVGVIGVACVMNQIHDVQHPRLTWKKTLRFRWYSKTSYFSIQHTLSLPLNVLPIAFVVRGDQRGGTHTNERLHVKLITIPSNGLYGRR